MLRSNDPCWCGSGKKLKRCHRAPEGRLVAGKLSPTRTVPPEIGRPPYAESGQPPGIDEPMVKAPDVIERMRVAGAIAGEVLAEVGKAVAPGITTDEIDRLTHEACIARGAYPSPLNYRHFPKSVCTSVNEVICHGIPDDRELQDGDIVNIDVTTYVNGVHGDTNATYEVGVVDGESRRLIEVTRRCLELGIAAVVPGRPISDIGRAIQEHAEANRCSVIRAFVGHGIGEQFHGKPSIFHFFDHRADTIMRPGMTFTIEPMIGLGDFRHQIWPDGWTATTIDGSRVAQFEHTLLVTDEGAEILTLPPA